MIYSKNTKYLESKGINTSWYDVSYRSQVTQLNLRQFATSFVTNMTYNAG